MTARHLVSVGLGVLALAAAGCGSSGDDKSSSSSASASTGATTTATAPAANTNGEDLSKKPKVTTPGGKAPKELVVKDLVTGTGRAVVPGVTASVQYVGVLYENGKQFDASWDRGGDPFSFQVGAGQVIEGWDRGLIGMKVGGRRELIIPAKEAYGAQSPSPDIPPNSPLIFVIDLKGLQ